MKDKIIIRAPKGFTIKYRSYKHEGKVCAVYCDLIDISKPWQIDNVGHVELERVGYKTFVTHSSLRESYHGRGLGNLLYAKAIAWALNHGYRVRSSGDSSDLAKRVWKGKGLRKHFRISCQIDKWWNDRGIVRETWYPARKPIVKRKK